MLCIQNSKQIPEMWALRMVSQQGLLWVHAGRSTCIWSTAAIFLDLTCQLLPCCIPVSNREQHMMTTGTSASCYPESVVSPILPKNLPSPSSCLEQMASYHNWLTVPPRYSSLEDGGQNGLLPFFRKGFYFLSVVLYQTSYRKIAVPKY